MPKRTTADTTAIDRLARTQMRLATSGQLRATGLTAGTAARRCAAGGPWQRLLPGVVLIQTGRPNAWQQLLAAVLFAAARDASAMSGNTAVLTGESVLAIYGVRGARTDRADVLVGAGRRLRDRGYVHLHPTRRWPPTLRGEGIPCVRAVRAASDFAAHEPSPDRVRALLVGTVQRGRCHPDDLRAELHASHALRNPAVRAVLDDLRVGVHSLAEGETRDTLLNAGIPDPLWNPTLRTPSGTFLARPDAYWPDEGVALEVDSAEYHLGITEYRDTVRRRLRLESHGVSVLSVTPSLVRDHPEELIAAVLTKLHLATTHPPRPTVLLRP
ncbi:hypothetical protein [Streptomyces niveus]|uniref:hypothetical protein n=1 Tax=Streptomyces niveus TaxID=193462 RepID=UPI0003C60602|nr:hypothetical protein [Streptomyces niveus]EST23628.1 hypothetical protein M877_26665 [Streptomyces niveus NCIMB 11891]